MQSLMGRHSLWDVWQDFIIMSAISISNVFNHPKREEREKQYMIRAKNYTSEELKVFSQMFAEMVDALERNPDQDFLGELFMTLELGDKWKGQFFTPYDICRLMAGITMGDNLQTQIAERGWISVADQACGAGALLAAFANECNRLKINYQTSVLFVAQDIDPLAACMCYIQLSLLGCPGYVVVDNTLTNPTLSVDERGLIPVDNGNVWYTPMYYRDTWRWRRLYARMDAICRVKSPESTKSDPPPPPLKTTKAGQLTLF